MVVNRATLAIAPAKSQRLIRGAGVNQVADVSLRAEHQVVGQVADRKLALLEPLQDGLQRQLTGNAIQFSKGRVDQCGHGSDLIRLSDDLIHSARRPRSRQPICDSSRRIPSSDVGRAPYTHPTPNPGATAMIPLLRALAMFGFLATLFGGRALAAPFPDPDKLPVKAEFPDPLVMFSGERVGSKEEWFSKRRPELKQLIQFYMYVHLPPTFKVQSKVEHTDTKALNGKATLRDITLTFEGLEGPAINLLLVTPNNLRRPVPAFVGITFCGNHALTKDSKVRVPTAWMYPNRKGVKDNHATEEGRGSEIDTWALEQSIDRGYAVATFYNGDVDPDRADKREGIQKYLPKRELPPGASEPATIAWWAWGVHRVVDYLTTNPDVDSKRIAVVGHSRLGKTALVAAAFDDRIALAIPHQSGTGGAAPSRSKNPKSESVKRINTSFPHWFNANFKQFNDQVEKLPFDQHCLTALCAPRPVLFTNAVEDQWANPDGQFDVLKAADPVYRFLNEGGLEAKN